MNISIRLIFIGFSLLFYATAFGQSVGVSNNPSYTISSNAILDLDDVSGSKGLLVPRMTLTERGDVTPSPSGFTASLSASDQGMVIFNTDNNRFEYWDGVRWQELVPASAAGNTLDEAYDEGGSGLGRVITADAGAVEIQGAAGMLVSGDVGVGVGSTSYRFEGHNTSNRDGFFFRSTDGTTGERDVFTIVDEDIGGGSQDGSSSLKVLRTGAFDLSDDGSSLLELTYTGGVSDADEQFYVLGRTTDEGAVNWGVSVNDADVWTTGSLRAGASGTSPAGTNAPAFNSPSIALEASGDSYLNTGGNLGVGTSSPAQKLQLQVSQNSGLSFPMLIRNAGAINSAGTGSGIGFNNHNGDNGVKAAIYNERVSDYGLGKMHILMSNSSNLTPATLADARLTVLSNGNVGVGAINPTAKLEVNGNIKAPEGFFVNTAVTGSFYDSNGAEAPYSRVDADGFHTNGLGDGQMYIEGRAIDANTYIVIGGGLAGGMSAEDVGIGVAPTEKLDVDGKIRMRTGATNGYVPVGDANGVMTWTDPSTLTAANDNDWVVSGNTIYNANSGNVGVGTSTPSEKLDVSGNLYAQRLLVKSNTVTTTSDLSFTANAHIETDNAMTFSMDSDNDETAAYIGFGTNSAARNGSYSELVRIMENGNVGIGTMSPTDKLEVSGSAFVTDRIRAATTTTTGRINAAGGNDLPGLWLTGEDNIWFDDGQVRITTHDGYGNWQIKSGADNDDVKIGSSTGAVKIRVDENGRFYVYSQGGLTNGDNISWNLGLYQLEDGNVGIGTTPTQNLDVNANARIRGLSGSGNRLVTADANGVLGNSTSFSIGQGVSEYTTAAEAWLTGNNTGTFSYAAGAGWTPGTWQNVSGFTVTRNVTAGNAVHVSASGLVEADNYNYYAPSCVYFRLMRGGIELARTSVYLTPASYVPSNFWYFTSGGFSFDAIDTGVSGNQTYTVQYWIPDEHAATEYARIGSRRLNVIELRQ